jgi:hypothetical protein
MKQAISILLALVVLFSPLQKMWLVVSFKLNQDYIAKYLCENKAKPKLQCKGQCQLKKQLKKVEKEEEQQLPTSQKGKVEITLFYAFALTFDFHFFDQVTAIFYPELNDHSKPLVVVSDIFQPPQV